MNILKPLLQVDFTLTVVKDLGMLDIGHTKTQRFCVLRCFCGHEFKTRVDIGKRAKTCRLCSSRKANLKHGESCTHLYRTWQQMKKRCGNYEYYEHVKIAPSWKEYLVFKEWAIHNGYKENLELDRIDNNKDYSPSNCRWADRKVQGRNTRKLFAHNTSGYRGVHQHKGNKTNPWKASIKVNNKQIHLGYYKTALEGAKAYDRYVVQNGLEHTRNGVYP